jgi:transcriptional regulator with XRE-family HTH domain
MIHEAYEKAGENIKFLRKSRHMTQEDLAEKANLTPSYLSFLESGSKKGSLDAYIRLAQALGVPLKELFDFKVKAYAEGPGISLSGLSVAETNVVRQMVKHLKKTPQT